LIIASGASSACAQGANPADIANATMAAQWPNNRLFIVTLSCGLPQSVLEQHATAGFPAWPR
jgi:hypothetical protein